jgi:hypothetical protein
MKHLFRMLVIVLMLGTAPVISANATEVTPIENKEETAARLQSRLEEIKQIDKSSLSREEKKALRGEVRAIKKELKEISGGVYLSVGAILLIALLIILLA